MDQRNPEDITRCNERDMLSPPSQKRPRTEYALTTGGRSGFDLPEPLTFQNIPSSAITPQKNAGLITTDVQDVKPQEQEQGTKLNVTTITQAMRSSKLGLIAAVGHFSHPQKCEQSSFTGSDKLSSYSADDADGALAESHTSESSGADTSSPSDCQRQGKSLDDQPPSGSSFPSRNGDDGAQVQNNIRHMQAVTVRSSDEQVRCQSGYADAPHDAGCTTCDQSELEGGNQEENFSEDSFTSQISPSDVKLPCSNPGQGPSGNLTDVGGEEIELRILENSIVCDGPTEDQGNENGMRKTLNAFRVNYAERSVASHRVAPGAISADSASPNDLHVVQVERTSGQMIGKLQSGKVDHTTETPLPARISRESAEGGNDGGPFIVIDPTIWRETDRTAEKNRCAAESTAGVELSPSVEISEIEMPLPLCSDVWPSQGVSTADQSGQCFEQTPEREEEPQSGSVSINKTCKSRDEGICQQEWSSGTTAPRPREAPPTGGARQQSGGPVGCQLREQDQSHGAFGPVKTPVFESSQTGNMDDGTEIKDRGPEEKQPQQNEPEDDVDFSDDYLDQLVDDMCEGGPKSQLSDHYLGGTLMCLPDHSYRTDMLMLQGSSTREEEDQDVAAAEEELKAANVSSHVDLQHQSQHQETAREPSPRQWDDRDELALWFLPTSDAVVPGSHHSDQSRRPRAADGEAAAPDRNDRCSLVPSALLRYDGALGGFDTFQKIQLAPDEDDDEGAGLADCPLLTSLLGQMPKTSPRRALPCSAQGAESGEEEEGEEGDGCDTYSEKMGDGLLKRDISCEELADFILAEDVIDCQPDADSVHARDGPRGSDRPAPAVNHCPEFDMVLKELKLFFDISRGDFACDGGELPDSAEGALRYKDDLGSLEGAPCRHTSSDADEDGCLTECGGDPVASGVAGGGGGEQEVPRGGHLRQQASPSSAEEEKEPREAELGRTGWSPSFGCRTFLEQESRGVKAAAAAGQLRRLQPLRTCKGPIRVGLSKRAKTRHLHRPHPYK